MSNEQEILDKNIQRIVETLKEQGDA